MKGPKMALALANALARAAMMGREERQERMLQAMVAKQVYDEGQRLKQLAEQHGDDEALAWLAENEILDVEKIWPREEANALLAEAGNRIEEITASV